MSAISLLCLASRPKWNTWLSGRRRSSVPKMDWSAAKEALPMTFLPVQPKSNVACVGLTSRPRPADSTVVTAIMMDESGDRDMLHTGYSAAALRALTASASSIEDTCGKPSNSVPPAGPPCATRASVDPKMSS